MGLQTIIGTGNVATLTVPTDYVDTAPTGNDNVSVDCKGFRFALVIVTAGELTGGTAWTATVQQSSDNADQDAFADIESSPTADTKITLAAADDTDTKAVLIDLNNTERYLKLAWANTGTFTVSELSACVVLMGAQDSAFIGTSNIGGHYQ
jgi:hypothetical protein